MYADFRKTFDDGLKALVEAVSRVTNADQGRIKSSTGNIDWAEDWGYEGRFFRMTYTLIESSIDWPFTLLTEVILRCNAPVTSKYKKYVDAELDWMERMVITEALADLANAKDIRLLLEDQFPQKFEARLQDPKTAAAYDIEVRCRRMGEDNGKNQLVNVSNYLRLIRDYGRKVARKPTSAESERLTKIIAKL